MYTGKELDPDTGFYYSNARWYDSSLGRFITEDPIKDGLNWYGYCLNNPLIYVDPSGLVAFDTQTGILTYDDTDAISYADFLKLQATLTGSVYETEISSRMFYPLRGLSIAEVRWGGTEWQENGYSLYWNQKKDNAFRGTVHDPSWYDENYELIDEAIFQDVLTRGRIEESGKEAGTMSSIEYALRKSGAAIERQMIYDKDMRSGGVVDASMDMLFIYGVGKAVKAGLGLGFKKLGLSLVDESYSLIDDAIGKTRVGRWMSNAEYQQMIDTGKVQMSSGNMTHVTNPSNSNAFTASKSGSIFVEFDVPTNSIVTGGKQGWGIIPGEGSIYSKLSIKQGGSGLTMPKATNITKVQ